MQHYKPNLYYGFDAEILDWKAAGLVAPSFIRLHKVATLENRLAEKLLGKLSPQDLVEIKKRMNEIVVNL